MPKSPFRSPKRSRGGSAGLATPVDASVTTPEWYRDAIFYELRVRSFMDADGDGLGDFKGLTEKLGYLQDLGVTTLWLLPFYPSPLKDDGYDISDYVSVDPNCGTLQDFKTFLREAHRLGLRVLTELVLNHTSDQHQWFQNARRDVPNGKWRNYYVWSDTPEKFKDARIIFKDFEPSNWAWDPVAKSYYWHRFYSHQPDLNYDNPDVQKAVIDVLDFWMDMGVDGVRLDAVPYLFEREGTSCENLPETHLFLKKLRKHVDTHFPNRLLLGEANQWPEDAVAYFGQGDECQMAFHFPIMPRMFMSLHMEDRFPIVDILEQTPPIPANCQWATFLRNHDELTLEMVTEEERDYMYRVYAMDRQARINLGIRRRLAPLLGNDRKKIELMNGLLLSLPGTPVIYYGDEIGMGDNIFLGDRNGVRTPMQWSGDRNAGFSSANPQRLILPLVIDPEYHFETLNVEAQQNNPNSLLWWTKRLIAMRKQSKALSHGAMEFLSPRNGKVLSFIRQFENETVLVVANLSRFAQYVELDLARFKGKTPLELYGRTEFPKIGDLPYLLTLGPNAFYWFSLEDVVAGIDKPSAEGTPLPEITVDGPWTDFFTSPYKSTLEKMLSKRLRERRWFGGKARQMKQVSMVEEVLLEDVTPNVVWIQLDVDYIEGMHESYSLAFTFVPDGDPGFDAPSLTSGAWARLKCVTDDKTVSGILTDAWLDPNVASSLLKALENRKRFRDNEGSIAMVQTETWDELRGANDLTLTPSVSRSEQSNTSVFFGQKLSLKFLRKIEADIHPDLEISRFLTERTFFSNTPKLAGYLEYRPSEGPAIALGLVHQYIANQGSAWEHTLGEVQRFYESALASQRNEIPTPGSSIWALTKETVPPLAQELIGTYLATATLIGQRTAEMHAALASDSTDPDFRPEPFTSHYQWEIYQSMRAMSVKALTLLRERLPFLPEASRTLAEKVLAGEPKIKKRFKNVTTRKISAVRTRCHGDYHLGQLLYTGKDFVVIDFEGEPARPMSERRIKRSPLRDVAGMLRSFHYVAKTALTARTAGPIARPEDAPLIGPLAFFWQQWVSATFLKSYLETAASARFLPNTSEEVELLLNAFLTQKALYELLYELNNRPDWVGIPLQGLTQLIDGDGV